jgi:hypothetical protein
MTKRDFQAAEYATEKIAEVADRAKRLMEQVMKTWNPPRTFGSESPADIAQTSLMIAMAYIMGREFMPAELTVNQREAIDSGLKLLNQVLGK